MEPRLLTTKDAADMPTRKTEMFANPDGVEESNRRLDEVLARKGLNRESWGERWRWLTKEERDYIEAPFWPEPELGFVYFIQAGQGGAIKIGYAADVTKRIASLQTAQHTELKVLLTVEGDPQTEAAFHRKFSRCRIRGEWFKPTPYLMSFINSAIRE